MSNNKMTTCKTCGKEMAKSAKVCPSCGAKNKKPIFTRPWFIAIIVVIVIIAIASGGKSGNKTTTIANSNGSVDDNNSKKNTTAENTTEAIEYTTYTVDDLMAQLSDNALKASDAHKGENVRITGKLGTIDSSGKYISLLPDTDFAFVGVTCYIKNDETKAKVADLSKDSMVTLTGKITDVGEVLGYSLNIDNIE